MTHIEQMIQDLCPQGVEFKKLGEVTYWDKRFNEVERSMQPQIRKYHYYLASELEDLESPTGTIKILYTSNKIAYAEEETVAENVVDAEVVAIPWGGNANIKYFKGKFVTADNRIAVVRDTSILSTKFVYYWLKQNQEEIDSYYRGAGIKHPSMLKVLSFEIPIPPMEVQKHIVTVLDAYSALAAELQAELQMRRKQYEYYRTQLLTPHSDCNSATKSDGCNWEWKTLGEICYSIRTGLNPRKFFRLNTEDATNYYVTIREIQNNCIVTSEKTDRMNDEALSLIQKRSNIEKGDLLFSGTGTIGQMYVVTETPKNWGIKEGIYVLKPKAECVLTKFLYYILATDYISKKINDKVAGGIVMSIPMKELMAISIPLPPISEQERIVSILDKFEALTTSLSDGIPAEQAAQQKRYEYYRDKLLTFEKRP